MTLTYERAAELFETARSPYAGKPLANNTRLHEQSSGNGRGPDYAVQLHGTDVVTLRADGTYELNTGGWYTVTTKDRINGYSPARVSSERGTWFVYLPESADHPRPAYPEWDAAPDVKRAQRKVYREWIARNRVPFYDGIVVDANGVPTEVLDPQAAARKWCREHGLRVRHGHVTLWKAVNAELKSNHGTIYKPRTTVIAPDFLATRDCGNGLHFGPLPHVAARYHGPDPTFLKCRVPLDTLVPLGDKCKARECYVIGRAKAAS